MQSSEKFWKEISQRFLINLVVLNFLGISKIFQDFYVFVFIV